MQAAKTLRADQASIDIATARQTIEYILGDLTRISGLEAAAASLKLALDELATAERQLGEKAQADGHDLATPRPKRRPRLRLVSRTMAREHHEGEASRLNFREAIESYVRALRTPKS